MTEFPNWFAHYAQGFFENHLRPLAGQPGLRFLQVGAFTGDASLWLLNNILTGPDSVLVDVDTWEGSDEEIHGYFDFAEVERLYDERTASYRAARRLVKVKASSHTFFAVEPREAVYDFAYIDGDHVAAVVLNDGRDAFRRLRGGGLLAFDDYLWKSGKGSLFDPGPGVDVFAALHAQTAELLGQQGLQVWFRKVAG